MIAASTFVLIMAPGIGFFYGGFVTSKNILSTIGYTMIIFAIISIVWAFVGFSLIFGTSINGHGFIGDLEYIFIRHVGVTPHSYYAPTIPFCLFFFF